MSLGTLEHLVRLTPAAARERGILCDCGDLVAPLPASQRPHPLPPKREDGTERGTCACFRRRARCVPVNSRR